MFVKLQWHETDMFLTCDWKHVVHAENISRSKQSQSKDWFIFLKTGNILRTERTGLGLGFEWAQYGT